VPSSANTTNGNNNHPPPMGVEEYGGGSNQKKLGEGGKFFADVTPINFSSATTNPTSGRLQIKFKNKFYQRFHFTLAAGA
jgi:hypothetical protein